MDRQIVLKQDILDALSAVGMRPGQTVMVHCSLSALGYVCGGAQPVIEALLQTVGETGTIMMPTQSWKNLDPESGVHWQEPQEWWQLIRDNWPAYDKRITPTNTLGAVAEMFRTWPGTLRSDHPARSVAANGQHAQFLTENHDLSNIFGDGSPIALVRSGRLCAARGCGLRQEHVAAFGGCPRAISRQARLRGAQRDHGKRSARVEGVPYTIC